MNYMAYVEKTDELIDEEVTIKINGVVFTGFSTVCPYKIEEGKNHPVILDITAFDDIEINEGIDGATFHREIIDGVKIDVIKIGDNVVSGYPTGQINAPLPGVFTK
ncbi:hypothetical protein [Bacillus paramobilis]|uniref:hypothetical protein n=1 Tax=Bacillus paramobilis TaxID=2817477 RepID=UPI003D1FAB7B